MVSVGCGELWQEVGGVEKRGGGEGRGGEVR